MSRDRVGREGCRCVVSIFDMTGFGNGLNVIDVDAEGEVEGVFKLIRGGGVGRGRGCEATRSDGEFGVVGGDGIGMGGRGREERTLLRDDCEDVAELIEGELDERAKGCGC